MNKKLIRKIKTLLTRDRSGTKTAQLILPKVSNRKQYMEQLASMMSHKDLDEDEPTHVGRRTELKTYIVESNSLPKYKRYRSYWPWVLQLDVVNNFATNKVCDCYCHLEAS